MNLYAIAAIKVKYFVIDFLYFQNFLSLNLISIITNFYLILEFITVVTVVIIIVKFSMIRQIIIAVYFKVIKKFVY